MELKLVTLDNKIKTQNLEEFLKNIKRDNFYYFHRETSYKDVQDLKDELVKNGYGVYLKEVKYSLEESGYMYELHIL
jgi:ABC-type uncharacterized transport system YnjBCD substrate-binding protein